MSQIITIIGRPNVGKSTLFNRLIEAKKAIIDETSGTTRDTHYGKSEWNGKTFNIVDTGGYITNSDDAFEKEIRKQIGIATAKADAIIFLTDIKTGITDLDAELAKILLKSKKKIFLTINKVDNHQLLNEIHTFYKLGFKEIHPISAIDGSGTGELLDAVTSEMTRDEDKENEPSNEIPRITIVGRPNVGKSSLVNALIGEETNIVTNIPGTTRDAIHTHYNKFGHNFILVDTAGLRKKSKVEENIEFYSVLRCISAIEESDVCLLLIDAVEGIQSQDMNILTLILKNKKSLVMLVNKWDLVEKDTNTSKKYEEYIRSKTAPFTDFPIIFTSNITKQNIFKSLEFAKSVHENSLQRIKTSAFNELILKAVEEHKPAIIKGKMVKIKYAVQLPKPKATFAMFCNLPQYLNDSYKKYLENVIRKNYNFAGVPITIHFRQK